MKIWIRAVPVLKLKGYYDLKNLIEDMDHKHIDEMDRVCREFPARFVLLHLKMNMRSYFCVTTNYYKFRENFGLTVL